MGDNSSLTSTDNSSSGNYMNSNISSQMTTPDLVYPHSYSLGINVEESSPMSTESVSPRSRKHSRDNFSTTKDSNSDIYMSTINAPKSHNYGHVNISEQMIQSQNLTNKSNGNKNKFNLNIDTIGSMKKFSPRMNLSNQTLYDSSVQDRKLGFHFIPSKDILSVSPMGSSNSDDKYAQLDILPETPLEILSPSVFQIMKGTLQKDKTNLEYNFIKPEEKELYEVLRSFLHSLVSQTSIELGVNELNSIEYANIILHFLSQTIPTELYAFEYYIQKSMNVEVTADRLEITKKVSSFLNSQISQTNNSSLGIGNKDRDILWDCHFRTLIKCTMMSSVDVQHFNSTSDINRRQEIINTLGFPLVWKVIRERSMRDKDSISRDQLLFSALALLLRMTISTSNLSTSFETVREFSLDYYNVGQKGIDGAIHFTSYIEKSEDKRKFWEIINRLLNYSNTRILTLMILYNIALFRKSISSLIGNVSLFDCLCNIVTDSSLVPVDSAQKSLNRILSTDISKQDLQKIIIGYPIYIISRGISSCGQDGYNKIFEKIVWNDKFLKKILEFGEGSNAQDASYIARVLYSVAFRSSLKSKENRLRFSMLLIDNFEGFKSVVLQTVNQDTEVKIIALLQLLSTSGFCDIKYQRIFVDLFNKTLKQMEVRQKQLENEQLAKNRANELVSGRRVEYLNKLKEKTKEHSSNLSNEIKTIKEELTNKKDTFIDSTRRTKFYNIGLIIPVILGGFLGYKLLFKRNS